MLCCASPPPIFHFPTQKISDTLLSSFSVHPNSFILKTLTILIQSVSNDAKLKHAEQNSFENENLSLAWTPNFVKNINDLSFRILGNRQDIEQYPEIYDAYFKFISKVCSYYLLLV